jgi:hypothetical protein
MTDEQMDFTIDEELRGLADDYLAEAELPAAHIDRALAQVSTKMGSGASATGLSTGAKVGAAIGVAAAVIAAALVLTRAPEPDPGAVAQGIEAPKAQAPEPVVERVAPSESTPAPSPLPEAIEPFERPAAAAQPAKKTKAKKNARDANRKKTEPGTPPANKSTAKDELLLLQRARKAMRSGQPASCLTLLDEHEAQFPKSRFGRERDATRVAALCKAGREGQATVAAKRYVTRYGSERASFQPDDPCGK